jgi:hypothetical protein
MNFQVKNILKNNRYYNIKNDLTKKTNKRNECPKKDAYIEFGSSPKNLTLTIHF